MLGLLPPSSSETFFRFPAAACTISLPTSVEPVKATLSTSGWAASAAPAVSPKPVTAFTTPFRHAGLGDEAGQAQRGQRGLLGRLEHHGVALVSAGPSFHAAISSGKFHGMIWPTTPTGSRSV